MRVAEGDSPSLGSSDGEVVAVGLSEAVGVESGAASSFVDALESAKIASKTTPAITINRTAGELFLATVTLSLFVVAAGVIGGLGGVGAVGISICAVLTTVAGLFADTFFGARLAADFFAGDFLATDFFATGRFADFLAGLLADFVAGFLTDFLAGFFADFFAATFILLADAPFSPRLVKEPR